MLQRHMTTRDGMSHRSHTAVDGELRLEPCNDRKMCTNRIQYLLQKKMRLHNNSAAKSHVDVDEDRHRKTLRARQIVQPRLHGASDSGLRAPAAVWLYNMIGTRGRGRAAELI